MEWFKVKTQEVIFSTLSLSEKGILLSIQALTAQLERVPSEKEILMLHGIGKKAYIALTDKLCSLNAPLSERLRSTVEDAMQVNRNRETAKERMKNLRSKQSNVTPNNNRTNSERSGLDKIRVRIDKKKEKEKDFFYTENNTLPIKKMFPGNFNEAKTFSERVMKTIWEYWRKDLRGDYFDFQKEVWGKEEINTDSNYDLLKLMKAFNSYIISDKVTKDGMYMRITKWLREWVNYIPDGIEFSEEAFTNEIESFEKAFKIK